MEQFTPGGKTTNPVLEFSCTALAVKTITRKEYIRPSLEHGLKLHAPLRKYGKPK